MNIETEHQGLSKILVNVSMQIFGLLFRFNSLDSPFGWQVMAVARKQSCILS